MIMKKTYVLCILAGLNVTTRLVGTCSSSESPSMVPHKDAFAQMMCEMHECIDGMVARLELCMRDMNTKNPCDPMATKDPMSRPMCPSMCPVMTMQDMNLCMKVSMPADVDPEAIEVVKMTEDGRCSIRVSVPCGDCTMEMMISESMMTMCRMQKACTPDGDQENRHMMMAGASRMMQTLPCKVCVDCAQDIKVEYCKDEQCLSIMIPRCMPMCERIPVSRK